jgi:hypothetical protein
MIKLISPDHYDFGEPAAALVNLHSRGVDGDWMQKRAAAGVFANSDLKAKPGHSLIHLIAMGDTEIFGPNRNGDAFYGGPRQLDLPEPDWETVKTAGGIDKEGEVTHPVEHKKSAETFTDCTATGNRERVHTFKKYAHVFRNHLNRPAEGHKIHGEVPDAVHNDAMHRVELMIEVPHGHDWDDDLEKIANDKPVYFSMSCKIPHEICSRCGHKSRTLEERCPHLSNELTQITKTGHLTSAVNDWMTYFDISRVIKPADRIAWALTKAAQDQTLDLSEIDREIPLDVRCEGEPDQVVRRMRLAAKAAEIEKRLPLQASIASSLARAVSRRKPIEKLSSFRGYEGQSIPATLRVLADGGIYLRFNEFAQLVLGEKSAAKLPMPPMGGLLALASTDDQVLSNTSYDVEAVSPPSHLKRAALAMRGASLLPEDVSARAIASAASGDVVPALSTQTTKLAGLAREYAAYTLSFLDYVTGASDQRLEHYASAIAAELSAHVGVGQ